MLVLKWQDEDGRWYHLEVSTDIFNPKPHGPLHSLSPSGPTVEGGFVFWNVGVVVGRLGRGGRGKKILLDFFLVRGFFPRPRPIYRVTICTTYRACRYSTCHAVGRIDPWPVYRHTSHYTPRVV